MLLRSSLFFLLLSTSTAQAQLDDPEARWLSQSLEAAPAGEVERLVAAHMNFLASDEMGGRDTATVEGDITARYVEAEFRRLGLLPAGTDGYMQHYPLVRSRLDVESCELALSGDGGTVYAHSEQFLVRGASGAGFDVDAPVAWAGWGLVDETAGLNDFASLDVEGHLVMMLYGAPDGRNDLRAASSWRTKQARALELGARGIVFIIPEGDSSGERVYGWVKRSQGSPSLSLGELEDSNVTPRLFVREQVGRDLFAGAGRDWEAALATARAEPGSGGLLLDGPGLVTKAKLDVEELSAANVVGLLPGHDPELSGEVIVLSAHMDHVGRSDDGEVFNGADDNASGTTTVLTVANQLAKRPEGLGRSVAFLAVSGEEKGLLGSEWFVDNPTFAIERIVANINIDMVGRNSPGAIGATPSPDHPAHNTLAQRAVDAGAAAGLVVEWEAGEGDFRKPVDTYYARSDHMHFSNANIPVVFFFSGEHEDYHKVSDTLEKIDQGKMVRVARMVEGLVRDISDDQEPPSTISE